MPLLIVLLFISASTPKTLPEIRSLYGASISKSSASNQLIAYFTENPPKNEVELAYEGAVRMVKAKHVFFPTDKLATYNQGKNLLESALSKAPSNLEIRYLRYSIQHESPGFLGYNKNMVEDRKMLIDKVSEVQDAELKSMIKSFLLKAAKLNPEEKKLIE
ncbi:MAG: hypothetical protein L6Q78_06730 [Bacteroidia bacterium]|nr:hypothetical protein [Bacteroidia bacterium]